MAGPSNGRAREELAQNNSGETARGAIAVHPSEQTMMLEQILGLLTQGTARQDTQDICLAKLHQNLTQQRFRSQPPPCSPSPWHPERDQQESDSDGTRAQHGPSHEERLRRAGLADDERIDSRHVFVSELRSDSAQPEMSAREVLYVVTERRTTRFDQRGVETSVVIATAAVIAGARVKIGAVLAGTTQTTIDVVVSTPQDIGCFVPTGSRVEVYETSGKTYYTSERLFLDAAQDYVDTTSASQVRTELNKCLRSSAAVW